MNVRVVVKFSDMNSLHVKRIAYTNKKTGELIETKKYLGILAEQWDKYLCGRPIYTTDSGQLSVYVKESGETIIIPTYSTLSTLKRVEIPAVDIIGKWSE